MPKIHYIAQAKTARAMNIEIKYSLDENDYLAFQLYSAATNARIKAKRKNSWFFTIVSFIVLGILFYSSDSGFYANYFFALAVLTVFFFPLYSRWHYKKHYLRHIREIHKNNFGKIATLRIKDDVLQTSDDNAQSSINLNQIEEIDETGQHFFIKLLSGHAFIVPKSKLDNLPEFSSIVSEISLNLDIKHTIDNFWKWK